MDSELHKRPGHLINRSARLFTRWGEGRFRALGLATAQIPVLAILKNLGPMTQTEMARLIQIEQPTMAQLLTRMERDGLIQRTPDPKDKRSSLVSLTPSARKVIPLARKILDEGSNIAFKGFTDRELATLSRLMKRVVDNMVAANTVSEAYGPLN
jgi:MarR family transcriptional regulator, transcriptional regulator for hemolysin